MTRPPFSYTQTSWRKTSLTDVVDAGRPVGSAGDRDLLRRLGLGEVHDVDVAGVHVIDHQHVDVSAALPDIGVVDRELQEVLREHPGLQRIRDVVDGDAGLAGREADTLGVDPGVERLATRLVGAHQDLAAMSEPCHPGVFAG
jgi:hypothetical protein